MVENLSWHEKLLTRGWWVNQLDNFGKQFTIPRDLL